MNKSITEISLTTLLGIAIDMESGVTEYPLSLSVSWPLVCTSVSWFFVAGFGMYM